MRRGLCWLLALWSTSVAGAPKPGQVRENPKDGQRYVWIPAGTFRMGCSPDDDECNDDEKPDRAVTISRGFWMGQTEVTVRAWRSYARAERKSMPPDPMLADRDLNAGWSAEQQPIANITWFEASDFCRWVGGRLPSEAEWEYAARAGTTGPRYGDLDAIAWYGDNSGRRPLNSKALFNEDRPHYGDLLLLNENGPQLVAKKQPNAWNLYDMLGNVWEWAADWYDPEYYAQREDDDPKGAASSRFRVLRGGSWDYYPKVISASHRGWLAPASRVSDSGLRCVLP